MFSIIGPESVIGYVCHKLTHWLQTWLTVNLVDATLAYKDVTSKLVKAVTAAGVDDEDHVGSILVQIWSWGLEIEARLFVQTLAQGLVNI